MAARDARVRVRVKAARVRAARARAARVARAARARGQGPYTFVCVHGGGGKVLPLQKHCTSPPHEKATLPL
jgi:hypothetical protein